MAWMGALIGAGMSLLDDKGGSEQQQQQTVSKDPWSSAAPWLQENIKSGQALQSQYAANPFNAQQVQGYNNQYGNADYMRSLTGSVLGQLNGFKPFDRGNQDARPQTFQFPNPQQIGASSPYMQAPAPAPAPAAAQLSEADMEAFWRKKQQEMLAQQAPQPIPHGYAGFAPQGGEGWGA